MKKKILFLNRCWFVGGMERVIATLANKLVEFFDIYILVYGEVKNDLFAVDPRIIFRSVPHDDIISKTMHFVKNEKIDLVVGNSGIMDDMLDVYEELYRNKVKFIVCNHEYYFYPHRKISLMSSVFRRIDVLKKAEVAIFLNSFSLLAYRGFNDNGFLLPNPLTFDTTLTNIHRAKAKNKTLIAVGRWNDSIKRLDRILNVLARVLQKDPEVKLTLVGPYDLNLRNKYNQETINEQIHRLNIPERNLVFVGEQKNVEKYYRQADIMLMTSDNEGFSMVLTEAGATGLPALIFEIPGLDDIIKDGENGYIIEADNYQLMAEKVINILQDKQLYTVLSRNAICLADRFSQDTIAGKWAKLINIILDPSDNGSLYKYIQECAAKEIKYSDKTIRYLSKAYEEALYLEYQIMREVFEEKIEMDLAKEKTLEKEAHLSARVCKLNGYLGYKKGDFL